MAGRGARAKRTPHADRVDLVAVALDDALLDVLATGGTADLDGSHRVGEPSGRRESDGSDEPNRTGEPGRARERDWTPRRGGPGGRHRPGASGLRRALRSPTGVAYPGGPDPAVNLDSAESSADDGRGRGPDERLLRMLAGWRDEVRLRPLPARPGSAEAGRIISASRRRRSSRPVIAVAASIVALLVASAVVGSRTAQPGDALFPVTQALWADRADAAVAGEQVRCALDDALTALQAGNAQRAAEALATAAHSLPGVRDTQTHQAMEQEIEHLWSVVAAADPTVVRSSGAVVGTSPGGGVALGAPSSGVPGTSGSNAGVPGGRPGGSSSWLTSLTGYGTSSVAGAGIGLSSGPLSSAIGTAGDSGPSPASESSGSAASSGSSTGTTGTSSASGSTAAPSTSPGSPPTTASAEPSTSPAPTVDDTGLGGPTAVSELPPTTSVPDGSADPTSSSMFAGKYIVVPPTSSADPSPSTDPGAAMDPTSSADSSPSAGPGAPPPSPSSTDPDPGAGDPSAGR